MTYATGGITSLLEKQGARAEISTDGSHENIGLLVLALLSAAGKGPVVISAGGGLHREVFSIQAIINI
jgi:hypothetical protein